MASHPAVIEQAATDGRRSFAGMDAKKAEQQKYKGVNAAVFYDFCQSSVFRRLAKPLPLLSAPEIKDSDWRGGGKPGGSGGG